MTIKNEINSLFYQITDPANTDDNTTCCCGCGCFIAIIGVAIAIYKIVDALCHYLYTH